MRIARLFALLMCALVLQDVSAAETTLEAPGPQGPLKATLLEPDGGRGRVPVVLIVPGSGPTDRDGNNALGVKAAPYRLLAEALAQRGVSSVRIDKRGMFASRGAIPDPNDVTISDYAGDVHTWVDVIRSRARVSCVWILGHSEGGLVALAAAQSPEGLCGLTLASTAGRRLGDVLRTQLSANPANAALIVDAYGAIARLERGEHVDTSQMPFALQRLFAPAVQNFLVSGMTLDPVMLLKSYLGRVLVVQGDTDLQVGVDDARLLAQSNPSVRAIILPGVNHVLKTISGGMRSENLAAYADPSLPIAQSVVDAVADFVRSEPQSTSRAGEATSFRKAVPLAN